MNDLDSRLRACNPVRAEDVADAADSTAAATLLQHVLEQPFTGPARRRSTRYRLWALRGVTAPGAVWGRKRGSWLSGVRAKALISIAVAAAGAAAAATVIAMPSSPAGSFARPAVIAPTTLTAAAVLDQAARAAGSRAGWPNAQYWYSEDKYMCGGQLYTDKSWLWRHGNGVVEKTGPKNNTDSACSSDLFTEPLIDSYEFGPYTWSQLYTLPTDPATLKPKLMTDFGQGGGPTLFEDVEFVLVYTPAPPAVRAALFKVDASIPGVKVVGRYTDPLGRTGIALRLGRSTIVVDPASGAVIDDTESGSTVMYVTQGPVTSEPKLTGSCARGCPSAGNSGTAASPRSGSAPAAGASA